MDFSKGMIVNINIKSNVELVDPTTGETELKAISKKVPVTVTEVVGNHVKAVFSTGTPTEFDIA